jgi:hypothetical protein
MNIINSEYLKSQINQKKAAKSRKMNDHEYALNHKLLQTIRDCEENENENEDNNNNLNNASNNANPNATGMNI